MGISIGKALIVLAILLLIFGSKRARALGSDLAEAVKGFRNAWREDGQSGQNKQ